VALEVNWICNIEVNSTWKVYLEVTWMGSVFGIRIMDIEVDRIGIYLDLGVNFVSLGRI
jgi:hypothetical protein